MQHFTLIYAAMPDLDPFKAQLPADRCFAFAIQNEHGLFILIDSEASEAAQAFALRHELAHIVLNHLEQTKPLFEINTTGDDMFGEGWIDREREADKYAEEMTEADLAQLMQYADKVIDAGVIRAKGAS